MEMTTSKTIAVFGVIFACFAVLYPKIFHPLLMSAVTHSSDHASQSRNDDMIRMPPHLRKNIAKSGKKDHADEMHRMRGGPHPGMRAAAEMKKQMGSQGGRGGMMAVVLPMYAIGIVLYLVYTLTKVFGRNKEKVPQGEFLANNPFSEVQYDAEQKRFHLNDPEEDSRTEELRLRERTKKRDLENLLVKADQSRLTLEEMSLLKRRLLETEDQMTRILKAMEVVTEKVNVVDSQADALNTKIEKEDITNQIEEIKADLGLQDLKLDDTNVNLQEPRRKISECEDKKETEKNEKQEDVADIKKTTGIEIAELDAEEPDIRVPELPNAVPELECTPEPFTKQLSQVRNRSKRSRKKQRQD